MYISTLTVPPVKRRNAVVVKRGRSRDAIVTKRGRRRVLFFGIQLRGWRLGHAAVAREALRFRAPAAKKLEEASAHIAH